MHRVHENDQYRPDEVYDTHHTKNTFTDVSGVTELVSGVSGGTALLFLLRSLPESRRYVRKWKTVTPLAAVAQHGAWVILRGGTGVLSSEPSGI